MASFNKVIIMGNLTRTPELRSTPGGAQLADLTLAVNDSYKDKSGNTVESTHFIDITFWGKTAETICRWKKQGDPLLIEGSLRQEKWVDKETGKNRSKLKVHGVSCTFLNRGTGGGQNGDNTRAQGGNQSRRPQGNQPAPAQPSQENYSEEGPPGGYDDYATSLPSEGEPPF